MQLHRARSADPLQHPWESIGRLLADGFTVEFRPCGQNSGGQELFSCRIGTRRGCSWGLNWSFTATDEAMAFSFAFKKLTNDLMPELKD